MSRLPDLKRPKNEIVWWLAFAGGVAATVADIIDDGWHPDTSQGWIGVGIALLGLVQRLFAYGRETVADIEERYQRAAAGIPDDEPLPEPAEPRRRFVRDPTGSRIADEPGVPDGEG